MLLRNKIKDAGGNYLHFGCIVVIPDSDIVDFNNKLTESPEMYKSTREELFEKTKYR